MSAALCLYLVRFVPQQTELAGDLAAGELAAVEVHAPGAAEGEGRATGLGVPALARTRPAAGGDRERQEQAFDALRRRWSCGGGTLCKQLLVRSQYIGCGQKIHTYTECIHTETCFF